MGEVDTPGIYRAATAVQRIGEHRWATRFAEDWDILGNTNGGYVMAIASRASAAEVGDRDPVTITGHFTRPAHTGDAVIETEVVREGRKLAVVRSRVFQDDRVVVETLGTFAAASDVEPETILTDAVPPDLAPPGDSEPMLPHPDGAPFPPPSVGRLDLRAGPELIDFFVHGRPSTPRVTGWFRLRDGEPLDAHALIVASDAFP
ncbi:MAG: thioesterase family protein, partial [Acidimicrobiia bacterium]|nr:thioesterase family protein [Acidimicrobiia bacterium]